MEFDNFIVNEGELVCHNPDVPHFSQRDSTWKDEEYDFTKQSIEHLGCALTSATMVLKYHGINNLPNSSPLNVLSLNNWLSVNSDKWWRQGMTSWTAIKKLTQEIYKQDNSSPVLSYKRINPSTFTKINEIITDKQHPLIFEIDDNQSPSGVHYVVADGLLHPGPGYSIIDPYNVNRATFIPLGNNLVSVGYFYPKEIDFGYLILHADKNLDVSLSNSNFAQSKLSSIINVQNVISNLSFEQKLPLLNDVTQIPYGNPYLEYYAEDPESGVYNLVLSAENEGWYEFEIYAYDQEGNEKVYKIKAYLKEGELRFYTFFYDKEGGGDFALLKSGSLDDLIDDVWLMHEKGYINNKAMAIVLENFIESAKKFLENEKPEKILHFLNLFLKQLDEFYPEYMNNEAYEFLQQEVNLHINYFHLNE